MSVLLSTEDSISIYFDRSIFYYLLKTAYVYILTGQFYNVLKSAYLLLLLLLFFFFFFIFIAHVFGKIAYLDISMSQLSILKEKKSSPK